MKLNYVVDWRKADQGAKDRAALNTGSHPAMPGKPLASAASRSEIQQTLRILQPKDRRIQRIAIAKITGPECRLVAGLVRHTRTQAEAHQDQTGRLVVHYGAF